MSEKIKPYLIYHFCDTADAFDFGGGAGSTRHISPSFVLVQNGFFGSNAAFFTPQNLSE